MLRRVTAAFGKLRSTSARTAGSPRRSRRPLWILVSSESGPAHFAANSGADSAAKVTSEPSARKPRTARRWSRVDPQAIEFEPQELFPTIPPIIAQEAVDVSGPKYRPWGARAWLRALRTTPGWTRTVRLSTSIATILFMWRPVSTTIPPPTTWPASDVPAPRGMIPTPSAAAKRTIAPTSASVLGSATASGRSWYSEASVA